MGWDVDHPLDLAMPRVCLIGDVAGATLRDRGQIVQRWNDPLQALRWLASSWASGAIPPDQCWIGYLGYDLGRCFEELPARSVERLHLPLFAFGHTPFTDVHRVAAADRCTKLQSTFTRGAYLAAVERVIDYIAAGDVFQVNLSQVFSVAAREPWRQVFARMHARTPAAHAAFLDFGEFALLSNSPELFLRVTPDHRVITRPIKGTRPRGSGMDAELRESKKDQAELAMIVDLERNDLGRVCEIGSVEVVEPRVIEAHPTVYHGVATIEGKLRSDVTFVDLLRATFPSGSVTGAPKIRAMQIIDELEPVRRGPYCGAIGYLAADGTMEFNVAIRTMIARDGLIHIPVGGGIVADSDPAAEYEETLVKAKAMFSAVGIPRQR